MSAYQLFLSETIDLEQDLNLPLVPTLGTWAFHPCCHKYTLDRKTKEMQGEKIQN